MADIREKRCAVFGTPYRTLNEAGKNVAHSYVTNECFDGADAIVTARLKSLDSQHCTYVRTDLVTGEEEVIFEHGVWPEFTVKNGKLYHTEGRILRVTDIRTKKSKDLWEAPYPLAGPVFVTNDEKYGSACWKYEDRSFSLGRVNLETGIHEEFCRKSFPWPYTDASHCMINPVNPDQIFFCHEGDCNYITNRLWLIDRKAGTVNNIFRQKMDSEGGNGEACGHEHWSADGKGLYFIKYISATVLPKGVWYCDIESGEARSVASGGAYWHVGVSPDGNRLAADTQVPGEQSDVVLIDQKAGTEIPMVRGKTNWKHPCHPHPVFSPDGKKVCFTMLNEEGNTCVSIVSLADVEG